MDANSTSRFCKARTLLYSMHQKVEKELKRLVSEGTLEPIDDSDWAAPIVAVLKSDRKSVRICGDFQMTISRLNCYPISKVEDLFATLKGGKTFTKFDLSQAYQQLKLDADSRKFMLSTPTRVSFDIHVPVCPMDLLHQAFFRGRWRASYKVSLGSQCILTTFSLLANQKVNTYGPWKKF